MTRRDFGKPAFSLRKKRFVKTHALSLLGTTRLLSRSESKGHAATGFFFNVTGNAINWAESNQNKPRKADTIVDKLVEK
jgi:hypothetical protein